MSTAFPSQVSPVDLGYADFLRRLTPGTVTSTCESTGAGMRIDLNTGAIVIHPDKEDVFVEITELRGVHDEAWTVWRQSRTASRTWADRTLAGSGAPNNSKGVAFEVRSHAAGDAF
jgi:hypothetical protein